MPMTGSVVVKREIVSEEFELKIQNFTLTEGAYATPLFNFQNETWSFALYPNLIDGYTYFGLWKNSIDSPISVEFSVALKTSDGQKSFERCGTEIFDEWKYDCVYRWISESEFERQKTEFLSSGCLTVVITLKRVDFVEPARRCHFFRSKYIPRNKNSSAAISHESFNMSTRRDVQNENVSQEFEWNIDNFSLNELRYASPRFKFQNETWLFEMFPNRSDGHIDLCVRRNFLASPLLVEFSVALKTSDGQKSFQRGWTEIFNEWKYYCSYRWMRRSEFERRQTEYLSPECLNIIITLKIVDAVESASAIAAAESSCKDSLPGDEISVDKKYLDKLIKCTKCSEEFSLQNWFDHECQVTTVKDDIATAMCSCFEGKLQDDKIAVHKKCLDKLIKYSKCAEVVSLPNTVDQECQKTTVKGASAAGFQPMNKIRQDFKQMFLNQENCDVILKVKGQAFSAHKAILMARSSVFASMFRNDMKDKKSDILTLEDDDPSSFADFLCFLYCEEVQNLSEQNVYSLFSTAEKYGITDLRTMCLKFMKEHLSIDTFCETILLALLHTETDLIKACTDFFAQNVEEIMASDKWKSFRIANSVQSNELLVKYVKALTISKK